MGKYIYHRIRKREKKCVCVWVCVWFQNDEIGTLTGKEKKITVLGLTTYSHQWNRKKLANIHTHTHIHDYTVCEIKLAQIIILYLFIMAALFCFFSSPLISLLLFFSV